MITELGKQSLHVLYCTAVNAASPPSSFPLISLVAQKDRGLFPWHHFEPILLVVLVEIDCLVSGLI